jgi:hypothetical protein
MDKGKQEKPPLTEAAEILANGIVRMRKKGKQK